MIDKNIALGQAMPKDSTALAIAKTRLSKDERLAVLEQQVAHMGVVIQSLKNKGKDKSAYAQQPNTDVNKDGIPIGLICFGVTSNSHFVIFLEVEEDGYVVGTTKYDSLSAAAEAVSGVRRSGWVFWKLNDGTTLKEAFKGR